MFIRISNAEGGTVSAEQTDAPVFVRYLQKNGICVRCKENDAEGIVSADGKRIYNLYGRRQIPGDRLTAEEISESDYNRIASEPGLTDVPVTEENGTGITLTDIELALCDIYEILGGLTNG